MRWHVSPLPGPLVDMLLKFNESFQSVSLEQISHLSFLWTLLGEYRSLVDFDITVLRQSYQDLEPINISVLLYI